ncbi:MAG: ferritin-like domain-containing protein [Candidatus Binatia bacterium]
MAYFAEKNFFEDAELLELTQRVFAGDLTLTWYNANTEKVTCTPHDAERGFTYEDCNVGSYGYSQLPEFIRNNYSMAARGSEMVPGLPDLGYTINRKSDVWSDNVGILYEEAKARRWAPAVDIDWSAVKAAPLPADLEAAMSQLCTSLEEIALVLMEFPSRWVSVINQEFLELKSYLCAQMIDEARHVEVFRKRALAGGSGLKRASVTAEQALKEILFAETYPQASLACNVMLASLVLGIFRHCASISAAADAKIFRLCMQDTARSLAYGMGHMRYHLKQQPQHVDFLHDFLDRTEHTLLGVAGSPELLGPLIVLTGRGTSKAALAQGTRRLKVVLEHIVDEYFERLAAAGLDRRTRSRLSSFFPGV